LSPFLYYSLTSLTTVGFGDITLLDAFARSLTTLEAVVGQLFLVEELAIAAPEVVARRSGTRQIPEPTMISKS
jgi:Ion channel